MSGERASKPHRWSVPIRSCRCSLWSTTIPLGWDELHSNYVYPTLLNIEEVKSTTFKQQQQSNFRVVRTR